MKYPVAKPLFHGNERKYLLDAFDSSWISSTGPYIDRTEEAFAHYCGTQYALTCSNGTTALHLALLGIGIEPGDEVIVPTFTFVSTANAVKYCGATPVFVDCRKDTWNIDESLIEDSITRKTKAIIIVHVYGHPCEMEPIWSVAKKHGIKIVEDAAEAHGAVLYTVQSKEQIANSREQRAEGEDQRPQSRVPGPMRYAHMVGSLGDVATFSLYGNKIITCGEGGLITTNDKAIYENMKQLRGQGLDPQKRYWFPRIGYNYRMTNIQAAITLAQLEDIDWHLEQRRRIATSYNNALSPCEHIEIPAELDNVRHAYWMYSILISSKCMLSRDDVMKKLFEKGIETRPFFYPMHQLPPYSDQQKNGNYPVADKISAVGINLPTNSALTANDVRIISEAIIEIVDA